MHLSRLHIAGVLLLLLSILCALVWSALHLVPAARAQTYSGAILICLVLIGWFAALWFRR